MGAIFLFVNPCAPWSTCVQRHSVSKLITRDVTFDIRGGGGGSDRDDIFHVIGKGTEVYGRNEFCLHDVNYN